VLDAVRRSAVAMGPSPGVDGDDQLRVYVVTGGVVTLESSRLSHAGEKNLAVSI
jgi:hypothetical protein